MYRLELMEQVKLRTLPPAAALTARVHPAVWTLGVASFLTDVSAEMVVSILPIYLVVGLRMNPLQYGAIDGVYNGAAIASLSLAAGLIADRTRRHKEVAAAGYGLSALCKLLLMAGSAWSWIAAVTALDRAGKGTRTAPRDALISFYSEGKALAASFAVHRALDAAGSLAGPLLAFALLSRMPGAFDAVWAISFVFALLGLTVLWLFIRNPTNAVPARARPVSLPQAAGLLSSRRYRALAGAATLLSFATISDGFIYIALQRRGHLPEGYFPLFYLITASFCMLFSLPIGRAADYWGRGPVLLAGYGAAGAIYLILLSSAALGHAEVFGCLALFGVSYAATEGVLMAMASAAVPPELRTSGLALLATFVGFGKFGSSLMFGWLWHVLGIGTAIAAFVLALVAALPLAARCLLKTHDEILG